MTKSEEEIEVTPEMIEAGVFALVTTRGWARKADEDWPALMTNAYRAMVKASRNSQEEGSAE